MNVKNKQILNYMTKIAIFSALSSILYFVPKFPLPFLFPAFLDIQFSNLPAILGGFAMGPVGGILIIVIRTLIKLPFSSTAYVGEFADLLIGIATVLTSSLIYKTHKTKKGGIVALLFGTVAWVVSSMLMNWLVLLPFYMQAFYGGNTTKFIEDCIEVLPNMNTENFMKFYIFGAVLPFNALLATMVGIITFFVYKRISIIFKKDFIGKGKLVVQENNVDDTRKKGANDENNNC